MLSLPTPMCRTTVGLVPWEACVKDNPGLQEGS
jgi:hypothetical protein